jgi:hypothetical protein
MVETGWGDHLVPREQLYDLIHDPNEHHDLSADPTHADKLGELAERVDIWMEETDDALRHGPVEPPPGAIVNAQTAISPAEEPRGIDPLEETGAHRVVR